MDLDCSRVRLRIPSPSPPPRIRLRLTSDPENPGTSKIVTPRRRDRRSLTHAKHPRVRSQTNATKETSNLTPHLLFTLPDSTNHLYELDIDVNAQSNRSPEVSDIEDLPTTYHLPATDQPPEDPDDSYDQFVNAVLSQICSIYQLTQRLFLVNGWNSSTHSCTSSWYHLIKMVVSDRSDFVCMCPLGKISGHCFHKRFLKQYGDEQFPDRPDDLSHDNQTFLVSRIQEMREGIYSNVFSVPKQHKPTLRNRAVIQFVGSDDGQGTWNCSNHPRDQTCIDILHAQQSLQRLLRLDEHAQYPSAPDTQTNPVPVIKRAAAKITDSISHLPRPVPIWARISVDKPPPPITAISSAPDIIPLEVDPSCRFCKSSVSESNPFILPVKYEQSCLIYGLANVMYSKIERQRCPSCNRWLGPDCRNLGLFNWNNHILMTHQLLDDYTSCFTTSETPFTAWVAVVSRRYPPNIPFVPERTFRDVWFSYISLVNFEGSSKCPICGPTPDAIIFDGVSLSFNRRNILPTLSPPTTIHADSVLRDKVVRCTNLQLIPDRKLRKDIRNIITGPSLLSHHTPTSTSDVSLPFASLNLADESEESGSSMDEGRRQRNNLRRQASNFKEKQALLARVNLIPSVINSLSELSSSLARLFHRVFGVPAINAGLEAPRVYHQLFVQITAEETSLQMMNNRALQALLEFLRSPDRRTASSLILIPALYNVLQYELSLHQTFLDDTLEVASWLYFRGETVRKTLLVHRTESSRPGLEDDSSWQATGCYYDMPKIRHRPRYPGLKEDSVGKKESGSDTKGGCRKFFSTYSPKRLTGGIMVAWCTHSISYGFHCIPIGEGRNDVFSALYTRWEKAPPVVAYDFACALQPYCLLREPEFFQDTLFVIDDFHASDHTKCCPSSFLATYCDSDPRLLLLNSSAAECGNAGLGRIRKSISYMSQDRAIMYCMVFLSIWNRHRIRKMEGKNVSR